MALTKQQKLDMIYDVELRLAKEELAEQYVKNLEAIENSEKPLRTLNSLNEKRENSQEEQAILVSFENTPDEEKHITPQQEKYHQTSEDKQLMEQSQEATETPFKKSGLDSKSQWEFIGTETHAMQDAAKVNFNIREHFENSQTMGHESNMGMER